MLPYTARFFSPAIHTLQSELHVCFHGSHSTCWLGPAALSVKKLLPGTESRFLAWGTWPNLLPMRWEEGRSGLVGGYVRTFKVCASDGIFSWPPGKTGLFLSSLVEPGGLANTWEFKSLRGVHLNEPILSLRALFFPSKAMNLAKEACQVIQCPLYLWHLHGQILSVDFQ